MRSIRKKSLMYLFGAVCGLAALGFTPATGTAAACHWHCETIKCDATGACTGSGCYQHCTQSQ